MGRRKNEWAQQPSFVLRNRKNWTGWSRCEGELQEAFLSESGFIASSKRAREGFHIGRRPSDLCCEYSVFKTASVTPCAILPPSHPSLCPLRRCPHFSVCWAIGKTSRVRSLPVHDPEVSDAHIPFLSHWWTAHPSLCFPLENQTLHLHWHLGLPLWCQSSFLTIASAVLEVYPGIRPHPVTHGSQAHSLPSSVPLLLLVLFEYVSSTQTHLCLSEPCLSSNATSSVQPFLILFSWVQRPYLIILSFLSSYMGHMPPCRLFSQ